MQCLQVRLQSAVDVPCRLFHEGASSHAFEPRTHVLGFRAAKASISTKCILACWVRWHASSKIVHAVLLWLLLRNPHLAASLLLPQLQDFGGAKAEALPSLMVVAAHLAVMRSDALPSGFVPNLVRSIDPCSTNMTDAEVDAILLALRQLVCLCSSRHATCLNSDSHSLRVICMSLLVVDTL